MNWIVRWSTHVEQTTESALLRVSYVADLDRNFALGRLWMIKWVASTIYS
jgi:hypothetical protein